MSAVLRFLAGYVEQHGYGPSIREIRAGIGVASTHTVATAINRLVELGYVRRLPYRARGLEVVKRLIVPRAPDGAPLHFIPAERLTRSQAA